jgi:hypothetical protein
VMSTTRYTHVLRSLCYRRWEGHRSGPSSVTAVHGRPLLCTCW